MNNRKLLCVAIVVCVTLSLASIAPIVVASSPPNLSYLMLAQKPNSGNNPPDWNTWSFSKWGQLDYYTPWPTFDYAFDGHGLTPSTAYTLLYYPDPYPANGLICLGNGVTDSGGNIEIHKQPGDNIGPLPISTDQNANLATTIYPGTTGARILLALSSDVDCNGHKMIAWQPTLYLFELWLIQYATTSPADTVTQTVTQTSTTTTTTATESNVGLSYGFIVVALAIGVALGIGIGVVLPKRRPPQQHLPPFTPPGYFMPSEVKQR